MLRVRINPAETLEANVQATPKLVYTLHRRMTEKEPSAVGLNSRPLLVRQERLSATNFEY